MSAPIGRWPLAIKHPLAWIMPLAIALRLWAALSPGFHHPDAIYQYLEPAHRLLTGEGVISWEWRQGIRSWLLPTLLAGPLMVGEAVNIDGEWPLIVPRLATGLASLGIVWAGWAIGQRHSRTTGILAALAMATWFETIFFAAETLAEPIAVAAIIPAAALLAAPRQTTGSALLAGVLLGFSILVRPHYAPAAVALLLVAWWPGVSDRGLGAARWYALIGGVAFTAAVSAAVDTAQGLTPFTWIVANFQQNIVHNVSAHYGIFAALSYMAWFMEVWRWWLVPATIGVLFGWRQAPGLLAAAAVTLLVHSLIPHKEYRFILLATVALALLAALGWGDIIVQVRRRWGEPRAGWATLAVFAMWILASVILSQGSLAPTRIAFQRPGWQTFAFLRRDPATCGVALMHPASFADLPGSVALRRGTPISLFWTGDPLWGDEIPWINATRWGRTFNRMVTLSVGAIRVPPGYRITHCEQRTDQRMCVLARHGGCDAAARSPYLINKVLARTGF